MGRRAKKYSEDLIREMLELYTMRPPFPKFPKIRKKKKKEPDRAESENNNTREDKNPC
jgi:hypothetical protein